jgi:glycosyltransferase involved in cell wall biosynthesis
MRVGFDARWYNDSGVGAYVAGLLGALVRRAECEFVAYESPGNLVPGLDGLSCKRILVHSSKYSLSAQFEFRRRIREDKLDVFHAPFYVMPFAAECPVVVTVHDLIPFLFRIYAWPKQWMVKAGYRAAVSHAAHIIADSQNTAADIQRILRVPAERITTVYCAVPQNCFHPGADAGELQYLRDKYGVQPPYVLAASASTRRVGAGAARGPRCLRLATSKRRTWLVFSVTQSYLSCRRYTKALGFPSWKPCHAAARC